MLKNWGKFAIFIYYLIGYLTPGNIDGKSIMQRDEGIKSLRENINTKNCDLKF